MCLHTCRHVLELPILHHGRQHSTALISIFIRWTQSANNFWKLVKFKSNKSNYVGEFSSKCGSIAFSWLKSNSCTSITRHIRFMAFIQNSQVSLKWANRQLKSMEKVHIEWKYFNYFPIVVTNLCNTWIFNVTVLEHIHPTRCMFIMCNA